VGTGLTEPGGHGGADALAAAGDECPLAAEIE
jgi:hypothetical protein